MGLEFIARSLRTYGIVLLIFLPFGLYYFGVYPTLAVLSGGIWGILNLMFITSLVRLTIRPEGADAGRAIGIALIKFPLLYAAGFALLKVEQFSPVLLLVGFGGIMGIIVLKVLGRLALGLDAIPGNHKPAQGSVH
ncbi:hypothetical protein C3F09_09065 [candidate division GN15 bacterium]|uniref:ATP synthase subunit I n=1 Tax=candidate division GN15 bacterium TaxID=2072418 RepID=A0A855WY67_9BACT|nr:MAG: hypothetical protein C3F09_09065 [candidate division GN15 bacterium]